MTHKDFIGEVAKRLEWPEEKVSGIIEVILEVVGGELKMNNPVVIDDFGTLKTDIHPEYILTDPKTKERFLMPPAIEFVFEALFQKDEENSSLRAGFTPDEELYKEVNSSFAQFEPTPLNEGVQFPGIPEIVAEEPEENTEVEEPVTQGESIEFEVVAEEPVETFNPPEVKEPAGFTGQTESVERHIITEPEETPVRTVSSERIVPAAVKGSPPRYRSSRRGTRSNKRTYSVWIPIAGGIAIVVASLFFFKGAGDRSSRY